MIILILGPRGYQAAALKKGTYNGRGSGGGGSSDDSSSSCSCSSSSSWEIVNRDRRLSNSLSSIAMADVEVVRPSRKKGCLAFLATGVSGTRIGDAMVGY